MIDPTIGRRFEPDPLFPRSGANPYEWLGNNPPNVTDPSGLAPVLKLKDHKDYKGYPQEVHEAGWIVWDLLVSGMADPKVREQSLYAKWVLSDNKEPIRSYYQAMEAFCKNEKAHGKGWKAVPVKFRLTGLEFHGVDARTSGPRKENLHIPAMLDGKDKGHRTAKEVAVGHFYIRGYWIFKCVKEEKGKIVEESKLYGLDTEGKAATWQHTPYALDFAAELANAKAKWTKDSSYDSMMLAGGALAGRAWQTLREKQLWIGSAHKDAEALWGSKQFSVLEAAGLKQITNQFLEVMPGDEGTGLQVISLRDPRIFGKDFSWPK